MATITIDRDPTICLENDERSKQQDSCLTILFAETVCLNIETVQEGSRPAQATNNAPSDLIASVVQKYSGQVVRTMGNSVMAEFSNPMAAVDAAVELQRSFEASQALTKDSDQGLRIGIYSSDDHLAGIEVFGGLVKAAASITKQASSGQILISQEAYLRVSQQPGPDCHWFRTLPIDGGTGNKEIFEVSWHEKPVNVPSRYEVISQVGKGGMGIVHKVRDRETDEIIALKILKPEIAGDPAMQENLRREVCLARKVTHKNVCRIHEFNRSNGAAFISMEFVKGESLHAMLHRAGPLPWNEAVPSALQICAGLREAHIQGIVHRDLKPANIMVDATGGVKIMDFGIARQFQGTGEMTGTMVGTPAYMAPEQLELKRVDARTDIYALGLLLYEMVTGTQPFVGETPIAVALKHLRETPKRPREVMPTLPAHAEAVILKCLQKDPAKRYQSVDELMMALRRQVGRRPAVSHWNAFVADFRRAGHDLQRGSQFAVQTVDEFLRKQNWKALQTKQAKRTITIGLGTACLLAGVIAFSVRGSGKNGTAGNAPTETKTAANQNSSLPMSATFAPAGVNAHGASGTSPITSFQVNLGAAPAPATKNDLTVIRTKVGAPTTPEISPSEPKVARTKQTVKAQPAHTSTPITAHVSQPAQPASAALLTSDVSKPEGHGDAGVLSEPTAAATPTETVKEEVTPEVGTTASVASGLYLEVGSFKDSAWADHAVEKLTQLGFQSISVRKARLWMQSYQVRVGPYRDQKDLEEARKNLVSQGFKPHPVK